VDRSPDYRLRSRALPHPQSRDEQGKALEKAREIASRHHDNAPIPVMMTKSVIDRGVDMSLADGFDARGCFLPPLLQQGS